jgi:hypothetical protein
MDEVYKLGDISLRKTCGLKSPVVLPTKWVVNIHITYSLQNEIKLLLQSTESAFIQPN